MLRFLPLSTYHCTLLFFSPSHCCCLCINLHLYPGSSHRHIQGLLVGEQQGGKNESADAIKSLGSRRISRWGRRLGRVILRDLTYLSRLPFVRSLASNTPLPSTLSFISSPYSYHGYHRARRAAGRPRRGLPHCLTHKWLAPRLSQAARRTYTRGLQAVSHLDHRRQAGLGRLVEEGACSFAPSLVRVSCSPSSSSSL